jgi:hypothetical protein
MMKKFVTAIEHWYLTRVQSHVSVALMALAFVDLTGYSDEITKVIGAHGYVALRLVGLGAIWWRATQVRFGPDADRGDDR